MFLLKGIQNRIERRKRRRLENDLYAKEARFWKGKIKSAERRMYDRPTNGQAVKTVLNSSQQKHFESNYEKLHDTPV